MAESGRRGKGYVRWVRRICTSDPRDLILSLRIFEFVSKGLRFRMGSTVIIFYWLNERELLGHEERETTVGRERG